MAYTYQKMGHLEIAKLSGVMHDRNGNDSHSAPAQVLYGPNGTLNSKLNSTDNMPGNGDAVVPNAYYLSTPDGTIVKSRL